MTPSKIVLERTTSHLQLRVFTHELPLRGNVIESVPFANRVAPKPRTVAQMQNHGKRYAKRFDIPFEDHSNA